MKTCSSLVWIFWSLVRFFPRFIPTTVAPAPVSRRHSRNSPKASSRTAPSRPQPPTQPPQPPKALCRGTRTRKHHRDPATLPSLSWRSTQNPKPSSARLLWFWILIWSRFGLQRHYFRVYFFVLKQRYEVEMFISVFVYLYVCRNCVLYRF